MEITEKINRLQQIIKEKTRLLVAFSGGVDSSVVAKIAYDVLGKDSLAVTLTSETFSKRELNIAEQVAKEIGIKHIVVVSTELDNCDFLKNPANRCYYCKKEEISALTDVARKNGFTYIADGVNLSDFGEHRPGIQALGEAGVIHPLAEAEINKPEIQNIAKALGLSNYDMPSTTCLASRFPYGEEITPEKLRSIEEAESFILSLGFHQVRVRYHGNTARIEVNNDEIDKIATYRNEIVKKLKQTGFTYISLDLEGYRSGSMNETLEKST